MASPVCFLTMRMLLLFLLSLFHLRACYSSPSMQPLCHDDESYALLQFKESLVINESASYEPSAYPKVASWKVDGESGDCCSWDGVECDGDSGHVIGLDLSSSCLYGSIDSNSSLFHLVQLRRLDLADNDFNHSKIPSEIRNLSRLFDLNLSMSSFSGQIPAEILELSKLVSLDLGLNSLKLQKPGLQDLVEALTNLEVLHLRAVNISAKVPQIMANLSSLSSLVLRNCGLQGEFPMGIFQLPNLRFLSIRYNPNLTGYLPEFNSSSQLEILSLVGTNLSGQLPGSIGNLKSLTELDVAESNFSGVIPSSLGNLTKLNFLDLSYNSFSGKIPPFVNLLQLTYLSLSSNNFSSGTIDWIGNLTKLNFVDMIQTNSYGNIPSSLRNLTQLTVLLLYTNKLTGEIPNVICDLTSVSVLELSHNNLSGKLPPCLGNKSTTASVLNLSNNSFSGDIPETFTSGCSLIVADFSQNKLEGKIPKSLANCTDLEILNLEQNNINDVFPSWLGALPHLRVLILRSNGLHGVIGKPKTNVEFPRLQIVDLSNNSFKGKLPLEYFRNWTAMKTVHKEHLIYMQVNTSFKISDYSLTIQYSFSMTMTNKGVMRLYDKIQDSLTAIDLSSNGFEGGIPEVLGDLKALHLLNLSNNFLSGCIPSSLSNLKELEALDLSQNKLSGEIPVQLVQLTFLAVFNVSHNFLSGPIPRGNQFGTFDNTSFDANSGLCGEPLSKKCGNDDDSLPAPKEDEGSGNPLEFGWKVVVIGYASGLLIGVILGCVMNTRKYEWVVKNYFARWQNKGQHLKNRLRRS